MLISRMKKLAAITLLAGAALAGFSGSAQAAQSCRWVGGGPYDRSGYRCVEVHDRYYPPVIYHRPVVVAPPPPPRVVYYSPDYYAPPPPPVYYARPVYYGPPRGNTVVFHW